MSADVSSAAKTARDLLARLRDDPCVCIHALDLVNRRALVIRHADETLRGAAFLDDRALTDETPGAWFPLQAVLDAVKPVAGGPLPHAIFHIGHCGSTLISRLLGELPGCRSLREPLPLINLAESRRKLRTATSRIGAKEWDSLFRAELALLGRAGQPPQRTAVKATSLCANLLHPYLETGQGARVLCVYVDLESWLATMLRNESLREAVRASAASWFEDLIALDSAPKAALHELPDAELAALSWVAPMAGFVGCRTDSRMMLVDFARFLQEPALRLQEIAAHFGLTADNEAVAAAIGSGWLDTYAKIPGQPFNAASRERELRASAERFSGEIEAAIDWACGFLDAYPRWEELRALLRKR